MNRRELVRHLALLLGGLSAPVTSGLLTGCRPRPSSAEPTGVLDAGQLRTAGALAERILPRTDTPGALDAGVDRYIDAMLADFFSPADRDIYTTGLARLDERAGARHGKPFAGCAPEQQDALVEELDRLAFAGDPPTDPDARFFRFQKELTIAGFYTSRAGATEELHPMPLGEYRGDVPLGDGQKSWS